MQTCSMHYVRLLYLDLVLLFTNDILRIVFHLEPTCIRDFERTSLAIIINKMMSGLPHA